MGSRRGAVNLEKYNEIYSRDYVERIGSELKLCRKHKLEFAKTTRLAAYLDGRSGLCRTTLTRNETYRALLDAYVYGQPGAARIVAEPSGDVGLLGAQLALTKVELGNLREAARRADAKAQREIRRLQGTGPAQSDIDFANLCMLLALVLVRAETFAIDRTSRTLIDLAGRPGEQTVGGTERAASFVKWVEENSSMPFVRDIKRVR